MKKKPVLIKCGNHYIDASEIRQISKVKRDLFIVKFKNDPNPQWPCWVKEKDVAALLDAFNIIVSDDSEEMNGD